LTKYRRNGAHLTHPLSRGDRPTEFTVVSSEEYFEDCDPAAQTGLDNFQCGGSDEFEQAWKGVVYCARQLQYDYHDIEKVVNFQISTTASFATDKDVTVEEEGCALASTMYTLGFYDCDMYNTIFEIVILIDVIGGLDLGSDETEDIGKFIPHSEVRYFSFVFFWFEVLLTIIYSC